jgi:hypothetical protein
MLVRSLSRYGIGESTVILPSVSASRFMPRA